MPPPTGPPGGFPPRNNTPQQQQPAVPNPQPQPQQPPRGPPAPILNANNNNASNVFPPQQQQQPAVNNNNVGPGPMRAPPSQTQGNNNNNVGGGQIVPRPQQQPQQQSMMGPPASASSFRLLLCADANGDKVNVETVFDRKPEMVTRIADEGQAIFAIEYSKRGIDPRRFTVDFIVFYDDLSRQWKPLESCEQLNQFQQLYLFQHDSNETVREIPPPSYQVAASGTSTRQVHRPGVSVVDTEKLEWLFKELDGSNNEAIEPSEMLYAFACSGVDFSDETVMRLFEKCDRNGDNGISWEEFKGFAEWFPNTCEILYWRLRQIEKDPASNPAAHQLRKQRDNIADLRRKLDEAERDRKILEKRVRQEHAIAREMDPRKKFIADEEQDLMNKEFALQFHRDLVSRAEAMFQESVMRFDQANMRQGSPRRARLL